MSLSRVLAPLVLTFLAGVEADCPDRNIDTSNVVFLKPDGSHVKCEGGSCPGISGGGGGWTGACTGAFSLNWRMVSWKGSTVCYHAPGYTYQESQQATKLLKNGQYVATVGQCDGADWLDSQLTQEVCTCGVPRHSSTTPSGTTTTRSTSAAGTSATTTRLTSSTTTAPITTTTTTTSTLPGEQSMPPNLQLFQTLSLDRFLDRLPMSHTWTVTLLGVVAGLALGSFGASAALRFRGTGGQLRTIGHEYAALQENHEVELQLESPLKDRCLE